MKYLHLKDILQFHELIINETGGSEGIRDKGRLESAIASQHQEVFGEVLYKSLHEKAAAILRMIIQGHPFVDGNKRTGMLAALSLLKINGYKIIAKRGEVEDFAVKIAVEKLEISEIAKWLENCSKSSRNSAA